VAVVHRRQPERVIVASVLVVADADQGLFEELHDGGDDLPLRQARRRHVGGRSSSQLWQRGSKVQDALELGLVPHLPPARMVTMLLPATRVPPRRLQMSRGIGTDPHVSPCRRDGQRPDPIQALLVTNRATFRGQVSKALSMTNPLDARHPVSHVSEAR
jgi:hypothetical protein